MFSFIIFIFRENYPSELNSLDQKGNLTIENAKNFFKQKTTPFTNENLNSEKNILEQGNIYYK